jgi:hypothetical protein
MKTDNTALIAKRILVGLTYVDASGEVAEQIQLHGLIVSVSERSLSLERADGKGEFSIPFDGNLDAADCGAVYTLRWTGERVEKVAFVASWTIHRKSDNL